MLIFNYLEGWPVPQLSSHSSVNCNYVYPVGSVPLENPGLYRILQDIAQLCSHLTHLFQALSVTSRIQFLSVVGLSSLFPFWLLARGHSQLVEVILWSWHMTPSIVKASSSTQHPFDILNLTSPSAFLFCFKGIL